MMIVRVVNNKRRVFEICNAALLKGLALDMIISKKEFKNDKNKQHSI